MHNVAGFFGQRKILKQSPFQAVLSLLTAQFKEAGVSNAIDSGILSTEKNLHIATRLPIEDFKALNCCIVASSSNTLPSTKCITRV
jgi:hypothetical protein